MLRRWYSNFRICSKSRIELDSYQLFNLNEISFWVSITIQVTFLVPLTFFSYFFVISILSSKQREIHEKLKFKVFFSCETGIKLSYREVSLNFISRKASIFVRMTAVTVFMFSTSYTCSLLKRVKFNTKKKIFSTSSIIIISSKTRRIFLLTKTTCDAIQFVSASHKLTLVDDMLRVSRNWWGWQKFLLHSTDLIYS